MYLGSCPPTCNSLFQDSLFRIRRIISSNMHWFPVGQWCLWQVAPRTVWSWVLVVFFIYRFTPQIPISQEPNPVFVPKKLCLFTHQQLKGTVARKSTLELLHVFVSGQHYRMVGYPRPFLYIPYQHQVATCSKPTKFLDNTLTICLTCCIRDFGFTIATAGESNPANDQEIQEDV